METPFLFLLLSEHQYRQLEGRHKPFPKLKGDAIEISVLWEWMRYSIRRSMHDNTIHLVFEETCFDDLPEHVRNKGPWRHLKSGDFDKLRAEYRQAINEHRYVIVEQLASVFSAET